jgi:hypothetical protein
LPVLFNVLARVVQEPDDVVIVERVERHAAGPPGADKAGLPEKAQLMRNRRLAEPDERRKIADASFAVRQRIEQPYSRRISENLEDIRDSINRSLLEQSCPRGRERVRIRSMALSARRVVAGGAGGRHLEGRLTHEPLYERLLIY